MRIYKIDFDVNNLPNIREDDERYISDDHTYDFMGKSLKDSWLDYNYYVTNPKRKHKDFNTLHNIGSFVLNKIAFEILKSFLPRFGEFLPFKVEGVQDLYLFNLTAQCDCIDTHKTVYEAWFEHKTEGSIIELITGLGNVPSKSYDQFLDRIFLDIKKIDRPLFLINDHSRWCHGPFCTSGLFPEDEEFYHICIKNKLQGIQFFEINYMKPDGMKKNYEFLPWK